MRHLASSLILALIAVTFPQASALATVKLQAAPQKFRTFYLSEDARIPIHIREQLRKPQRTARRGSHQWSLEADALIRDSLPQLRLSFGDGLPVGRLRAIAITTDGAVWVGGDDGLVRYQNRTQAWDRWPYFAGKREFPSDEVTALVAGEAGAVWVQTRAVCAHIEFRPMTLE